MANLDQIANYQADRVVKEFVATTGTVDTGSISSISVVIKYTIDSILECRVDARMQNVANGSHPSITISDVPTDMPYFRLVGYTLRRSGTNTPVPSDPCYVDHTAGANTLMIGSYNYIGQAPAGYVYYAI